MLNSNFKRTNEKRFLIPDYYDNVATFAKVYYIRWTRPKRIKGNSIKILQKKTSKICWYRLSIQWLIRADIWNEMLTGARAHVKTCECQLPIYIEIFQAQTEVHTLQYNNNIYILWKKQKEWMREKEKRKKLIFCTMCVFISLVHFINVWYDSVIKFTLYAKEPSEKKW